MEKKLTNSGLLRESADKHSICLYGVITRDPRTGVLQGGADPRGEAYAVGY